MIQQWRMSCGAGAMLVGVVIAGAWARAGVEPGQPATRPAPVALWRAHAHNDYAHARPLLDALDHGFASVEADVFAVKGKLLVGHTRLDVLAARDLDTLYLRPLAERVRLGHGKVYPDQPAPRPFILLIDFKTEGAETYRLLQERLAAYREMLSVYEHGAWRPGAVTVVLSGERPAELIRSQPGPRYVGIDGRLEDLDSQAPSHLVPMISTSWGSVFRWRGKGEMPEAEREKLRDIVRWAHARGRWVRFWGAPDVESVWKTLAEEGVDLVNTDKLAELQAFMLKDGRMP